MQYIENKSDINIKIRDLRVLLLDNIREDVEVTVRFDDDIIDSLIIIIENKLKYISVSLNSKFCQIVGKDIISNDSDSKIIKINVNNIHIKDRIFVIVKMISKLFEIKNSSIIGNGILDIYNYINDNEEYNLLKDIFKDTLLEVLLDEVTESENEYKSIQ